MVSRAINTAYSTGGGANGLWRAIVQAVNDNSLNVTIPRLGQNNVYENVPYIGFTPQVGDRIWVGFIEGRSFDPVAFVGATDTSTDITEIVAGTNLNGGGTSGSITVNLDDDITIDSLQFDITANTAVETEGLLAWNDDWGTVDIGLHGSNAVLHVGQQVYYYAKNQTGSQIDKGTVVRFDGALGASGHLKMAPFLADGTYPSEYIMGVAAHDVPNGDDGYVVHFGAVRGIDTETPNWNEGDLLYVSSTVTGELTSTAPSAPNNIILVAAVVNRHSQNGELFVRPTLSANILNDEAILYTSLSDNDTLVYNSAIGAFENTPFDHGGLAGLGDDDHTQYLLVDGSRAADTFTVTGDLVVDTDTLFVDASTDRVGINNVLPSTALDVTGTVTATAFSGPLTGNASTATALQTARTIGGVSFDGTANINLPGVNTTGNQDTSGNAATASLAADSSLLGGLGLSPGSSRPSTSVSQVIKTHTNGYTYLGWINTTSGVTTSTIDRIYASNDQFVRYITPATFRSQVTDPHYLLNTTDTLSGNLTVTGIIDVDEVRGDSGSVSDATFTFTGDENTGMYRVGSDRLGFTTGGAARMYIQNSSTGLTGSGSRSLSVKASGAVEMYRQATGAADGILALYSNHGSTADLQWLVYGDGDTASDTGSYGTISDNRLKTNIVAYKDPTDDLMAINVIKYDLSKTSTGIDDNGNPIIVDRDQATTMTGWDAQQVQSVKPGFVKLDAERGILSVKSSVFVPLLHRGFQVHEDKIAALEARIAALEAE
jgi:hypothetical protein